MTVLSAVSAVGAAGMFGLAIVLQQRAAARHGAGAALLTDPRWLAGVAADVAGFVLQITALHGGALTAVQAVLMLTLPAGLAIGGRLRACWRAAAVIIVALAVALAAAAPEPGHRTAGLPFAAGGVLVAAAGAGLWRRPLFQCAAAAACFAVDAALAQQVSRDVSAHGLLAGCLSLAALGTLATAAAGFALQQLAFADGELAGLLTVITAGDPVASTVLGLAVAGDRAHGGARLVVSALAAAVALAAVPRLARLRAPLDPAPDVARTAAGEAGS